MSAIDTVNHAHVGYFFGIPIYWFMEDTKLNRIVDGWDDNETVNQFNLSIGGGSGEHPTLILDNDDIVFNFLSHIDDWKNEEVKQLFDKLEEKHAKNNDIFYYQLDQNAWPLETFIDIHEKMSVLRQSSDKLQKRMMAALALFIIQVMPIKHCLQDPDLQEICLLIKEKGLKNIADNLEKKYLGCEEITDHSYGRTTIDKKAVWGYSLHDWKKEHESEELFEKLSKELPITSNPQKMKV